ncbi:ferritin-like domain-containing protein [Magnetospira sp. QH-2]|uniref:ferritin-like domain-containing protein n=1 Tax=Magnetospira sp. (strain QH-2) TaxID=1288970 RepID=UPI0003E80C5C|nr:ferritin-like domain-containing protein [Magnetospira sp. QH-2]CCQ74338.1 conserved protein of unknown function [Magnetospira sp. QH-2]
MTKRLSLCAAARDILTTPDPLDKVAGSFDLARAWRAGDVTEIGAGSFSAPDRPARPRMPELRAPRHMPRRSKSGLAGRVALLHAIAHIELNAIDLAWDLIVRFGRMDHPRPFFDDWVAVAEDEARHFELLHQRLLDLGSVYGDLPAHDGLWEAAEATQDDLMARLALVPMLLEARGLDTTPPTVARLLRNGDRESADILALIGEEEESHVAAGVRWFGVACADRDQTPSEAYQHLVRSRFRGRIKPPFNEPARNRAGLTGDYYLPLV